MSHGHEESHKPSGYGVYFLTWFTLLVLTALTVMVAGMKLGAWSIYAALVIAGIKASVVLYLFMHLRDESVFFHRLLLVIVITLVIFIGLTYSDTLFR